MHPRFASIGHKQLVLKLLKATVGVWLSGKALSMGEVLNLSSGILACFFSSQALGSPGFG